MHKPHILRSLLQTATRSALLALGMAVGLSACAGVAGASGSGGDAWQEEVLLLDGQKMLVDRWASRGGRSEVGQQAAIQAQSMEFTHPATRQRITWASQSSPDLRLADLTPIALQLVDAVPYLVAHPVGCQAYNKWERPNPPYVIFRYTASTWQRIELQQLPLAIQKPNLIISSPDNEVQRLGTSNVSVAMVERVNAELTQPEFRSILREPMTNGGRSCRQEFSNGRGSWLSADWFTSKKDLQSCMAFCKREDFFEATCPCNQFFKGE